MEHWLILIYELGTKVREHFLAFRVFHHKDKRTACIFNVEQADVTRLPISVQIYPDHFTGSISTSIQPDNWHIKRDVLRMAR